MWKVISLMRKLGVFAVLGWLVACVATGASLILLRELIDTRVAGRLETVRLPNGATKLPENWTQDNYRVLLVGDSRIRQWKALPQIEGVVFAKSGIGQETTGQLRDRFTSDVLQLEPTPDAIVLASGINDLVAASLQTQGVPVIHTQVADLMIAQLQQMATAAQARGIEVSIATIVQPANPDITRRLLFWDESLFDLVSAANTRILSLGFPVIDFNATLEGKDGPLPEYFSLDALHFNATAYRTLNDALMIKFDTQ